jgi:hypothetical protein
VRHVTVEDHHCCDMERDGRNEKGDVGKTNELIVDDDDVV